MTIRADGSKASPLFTFAVVGDTHVNPEDDQSSSPWQTNRLANTRLRAVVAQINVLKPDFVVHLGDMVHPVPAAPKHLLAVDRFRDIVSNLLPSLHVMPGNHDIGDKPLLWGPAASISPDTLISYRANFGNDFYSFDHQSCRFIILNSQLFNSGFPDEQIQWDWLAEQSVTKRRTFLFTHYPPFLYSPDEDEHYDNVAEPARSRLISMLMRPQVQALFCGHVHNFFYNRIGSTDCYVLPATSAVRHDYMEVFPVAPIGSEYGRDARSKLGFFLVEVFPNGHVAHWIHTLGETDTKRAVTTLKYPKTHARGLAVAPVGVDLRHGWADPVSIPYSGAVDEFGRKRVRNDYIVAALWEMGIRRLRIPIQDLFAADSARRIADLGALGHRFTVFIFGLPNARQRVILRQFAPVLEGIEIIERVAELHAVALAAASLRSEVEVAVFLSKLRVSGDVTHDNKSGKFAHFIQHGFLAQETTAMDLLADANTRNIDGLVFRVDRDKALWPSLRDIAAIARSANRRAIIHVRLADDPAQETAGDADTARRVTDTALAAWLFSDQLSVFFDTFDDHDRGYFPRHGLVDRSCDQRPAAFALKRVVETLHAIDSRNASILAEGVVRTTHPSGSNIILLGEATAGGVINLPSSTSVPVGTVHGTRLDTGDRVEATVLRSSSGFEMRLDSASVGMPIAFCLPNHKIKFREQTSAIESR
jgi:3',5'-cyclic AMP phosphodiesterase CpdA